MHFSQFTGLPPTTETNNHFQALLLPITPHKGFTFIYVVCKTSQKASTNGSIILSVVYINYPHYTDKLSTVVLSELVAA